MEYNFDYEISATIFLVLLYIFHLIQYNTHSKCNKYFKLLLYSILIANISDILTCVTISNPNSVPLWFNYVLNMIYYFDTPITTYILVLYMTSILTPDNNKLVKFFDKFNMIVGICYNLMVFTTPITKFLFYFDKDKEYHHGSLFLGLYIMPIYYMTYALVSIIRNKKKLNNKQFFSLLAYIVVAQSGTILQYVYFGKTMVAFFAAAIGAIILLFALETPDYQKLVETMALVEQQKNEAVEAKKEAEDANRAKSVFLANMSHEIRTPINVILGMDEIAMQENLDAAIMDYLNDIRHAGENLLSIINGILDFSTIESGRVEIRPVRYNFRKMIQNIKAVTEKRIEDKGLLFVVDVDPAVPADMIGDELRITQILLNFLSNAAKYTHEGTITLKASCVSQEDDFVALKIQVSDTGIGITKENQEKLFEAFHRVDLVRNRTIAGTGLGLSINKLLLDLMQGTITCESEYGKGTTFSVVIPQKIAAKKIAVKEESASQQMKAQEELKDVLQDENVKILVVDDVKVNLKVVMGLLKQTKIQIDTAESGQACLDLCKQNQYDLIFMDQMMPEMDGTETLKHLQEMPEFTQKPIPVVALTANAIVGAKEESLANGFTDFLTKPVSRDVLYTTIRQYVY